MSVFNTGTPDTLKGGLFTSQATTDNFEPKTRQLSPPEYMPKLRIVPLGTGYSIGLEEVLLNPESILETKSANWIKHNPPGSSDPILQWINGNEKVVSFTLRVTKDIAENITIHDTAPNSFALRAIAGTRGLAGLDIVNDIPSSEGELLNEIGNRQQREDEANKLITGANTILRQVGVEIPSLPAFPAAAEFTHFLPLSIQTYLDFYRSLLYPRRSNRGGKPNPPPLVNIRYGSVLGEPVVSDNVQWALLNYQINITKFAPMLTSSTLESELTPSEFRAIFGPDDSSLAGSAAISGKVRSMIPIDAVVQLTFIEYTSVSKQYDENVADSFLPEFQRKKKSKIKSS